MGGCTRVRVFIQWLNTTFYFGNARATCQLVAWKGVKKCPQLYIIVRATIKIRNEWNVHKFMHFTMHGVIPEYHDFKLELSSCFRFVRLICKDMYIYKCATTYFLFFYTFKPLFFNVEFDLAIRNEIFRVFSAPLHRLKHILRLKLPNPLRNGKHQTY